MEKQDTLGQATRVVNARIGFYIHLAVFVLVNALLITINLLTSPRQLWFQSPLAGWGIGIILHAGIIFGVLKGQAIRDRMIAKEMRKRTPDSP